MTLTWVFVLFIIIGGIMSIQDFNFLFPRSKRMLPLWFIFLGISLLGIVGIFQKLGLPEQFYDMKNPIFMLIVMMVTAPIWTYLLDRIDTALQQKEKAKQFMNIHPIEKAIFREFLVQKAPIIHLPKPNAYIERLHDYGIVTLQQDISQDEYVLYLSKDYQSIIRIHHIDLPEIKFTDEQRTQLLSQFNLSTITHEQWSKINYYRPKDMHGTV